MNYDKYILWLTGIVKLDNKTTLKIIETIEDVSLLLKNTPDEVAEILGNIKNSSKLISHIKDKREQDKLELQKLSNTLKSGNIKFISILNENYPKLLKEINDPPAGFYYMGELPDDNLPFVTIVGSRKYSEYASIVTRNLGTVLAKHNIITVSGLALGIDSVAHKSTIDSGGKTIAVLACGIDVDYPAENANLRRRIIENGCIISELPLGTRVPPGYFHIRNRIMSGLSNVTIVAEAGERSGTSITVNHALNQNRDVFAVPGNITNPLCKGSNRLIQTGCIPLIDFYDIITYFSDKTSLLSFKEIPKNIKSKKINKSKNSSSAKSINDDNSINKITATAIDYSSQDSPINDFLEKHQVQPIETTSDYAMSDDEKSVYNLLTLEPISIEEITTKLPDIDYGSIQFAISMLEMEHFITRLTGQRYVKSRI